MNTLITEDREAGAAAHTEPVVYEHNTLFSCYTYPLFEVRTLVCAQFEAKPECFLLNNRKHFHKR